MDCSGGHFDNPKGEALTAERSEIGGTVFLKDDFSATGQVNLRGAHIGADLECDKGSFQYPSGKALIAERAEINRSAFLRKGFSAQGEVTLEGSRIGTDLDCSKGKFEKFTLTESSVKGGFYWNEVQAITELDLSDFAVGRLWSDKKSWPKQQGKLDLDGLVYGGISDDLKNDGDWRLKWLALSDFSAQPYRQLARVLRDLGDDEGSNQILMELEKRTREQARKKPALAPERWWLRTKDDISWATIGYGISPLRALVEAGGLTLLGWIVFRRARVAGVMVPTDKDAYSDLRNHGRVPDNYPPFSPFMYSLENCIPLVKLGQDEHWQPDPSPKPQPTAPISAGRSARLQKFLTEDLPRSFTSSAFLRWCRWLIIILGWVLATFLVAGLSGIVKSN